MGSDSDEQLKIGSRRELIKTSLIISGLSFFSMASADIFSKKKAAANAELIFSSAELLFLNKFHSFQAISDLLKSSCKASDGVKMPVIRLGYKIGQPASPINYNGKTVINLLMLNSSYGRWSNLNLETFESIKRRDKVICGNTCVVTRGPFGKALAEKTFLTVTSKHPETSSSNMHIINDAFPHYLNAATLRPPGMVYLVDQITRPPVRVHLTVLNAEKISAEVLGKLEKLAEELQNFLTTIEKESLEQIAKTSPVRHFSQAV